MDLPNVDTLQPIKTTLVRRIDSSLLHRPNQRKQILIADKTGTWKKKVKWDKFGCISKFEIPDGWSATVPGGPKIISSWISPRIKEHCNIEISFYRYGLIAGNAKEISQRKKLLKSSPHKLTKREIDKLPRFLSRYQKSITHPERDLISCETKDLNGKRVIVVNSIENSTKSTPKKKRVSFLVDPTGEGTECLIIEYSADVKVFDEHKEKAVIAINSVQWREMKKDRQSSEAITSYRELVDFPMVETFKIPDGWIAEPKGSWVPGTTTRFFHPKENEEVNLYLMLVSHGVGHSNFKERRFRRKLVKQTPHKLSQNEIDLLPEYLSMYSSKARTPAKILKCKTIKIKNVPAIYVEVACLKDETVIRRISSLFIDPTGQGMDYIKIAFEADPKNHKKYYRKAFRAMKSVRLEKNIRRYEEIK